MKILLTIAGSDSSGGAGIQADLKTFSALGTYGMSVITAVTAQNTMGVKSVRELDREIIEDQINCLFEDIHIDAVKVGMVASREIIDVIGETLSRWQPPHVVIDPVMVSKSGCHLLRPEAKEELINVLLPLADVVTPNIPEAEAITGEKITDIEQMEKAALEICALGAKNVVIKGGHLDGDPVDVLYANGRFYHFKGNRVHTKNTHGTGCTFSSAIAAYLARGYDVYEAVKRAKDYITGAIEQAQDIGHGVGPTNHFYRIYAMAGVLDYHLF
ncbi:MAG: bifunctional hydroxymethylpyrimidine kinase/phosphomethylpyrimidine kinase [Thermacetogeniaceae bacterium]